ncbi:MAG TPA: diaminopimelate epimerase [Sneathiellales bacterium]|nr:diaminopimelate epimerase [Sneathiellales bacterium]
MTEDRSGPAQPFIKMHGLGNDFIILDARTEPVRLAVGQVRALSNRRTGVGFDQMITLEPSANTDVFMRIHNADGGEVEACGNAARCVAALIMAETGTNQATIDSPGGRLSATASGDGQVTVDMGTPQLDWQDIPLSSEQDTLHLDLSAGGLVDGVGVNIGNPHVVFFVDDMAAIDLGALGPTLEHDPLFPEHVNVSAAQIGNDGHIRLRVWERGVGLTKACGTAACATRVAAVRRNISSRTGPVELDGGTLMVAWRDDGHVTMTGPAATAYHGSFNLTNLPGKV